MPYCPKCDMEFVEGITVCSDCGGPLVASKEDVTASEPSYEEAQDQELSEQLAAAGEIPRSCAKPSVSYISSRQKSEDLRSSSSAFLLVGGVAAVAAILCWTGVIHIPMAGASRILFQIVLTVMGVIFLLVSFTSRRSAARAAEKMQDEEQRTKEIIDWFTSRWNGSELDQKLLAEDPQLKDEELALKRYEIIQDHLITGQDLPDPAYVDYLTDELYEKLYENHI